MVIENFVIVIAGDIYDFSCAGLLQQEIHEIAETHGAFLLPFFEATFHGLRPVCELHIQDVAKQYNLMDVRKFAKALCERLRSTHRMQSAARVPKMQI